MGSVEVVVHSRVAELQYSASGQNQGYAFERFINVINGAQDLSVLYAFYVFKDSPSFEMILRLLPESSAREAGSESDSKLAGGRNNSGRSGRKRQKRHVGLTSDAPISTSDEDIADSHQSTKKP